MSDWLVLIVVAYALYLIECFAWITSSACACFRHPFTGKWRAAKGDQLLGNDRGGLAFVDPLALSGGLVVCDSWPFSVDAQGVTNLRPDGSSDGSKALYIPFEEIRTIRGELGEIRINNRRFVSVGSSAAASFLTRQIERVWRQAAKARAPEIQTMIAATLDHEQADATWLSFQSRTRPLFMLCASLQVFLFVVSPFVVFLIGPYPSWMYLLAGVFLIALVTAVMYFRTHATLYPESQYDRWVHTFAMVLLPVAAIRCVDKLSRDALCQYNPAVVAPAVCGLEAATPFVRRQLIDISTPSGSCGFDDVSAEALRCVEWFRHTLTSHTQSALGRLNVNVFAPPIRDDRSMVSYCPRCHAQFTKVDGCCPECAVVHVVSFEDDSPGHADSRVTA
jgi:hypothetical protein